MRVEEPEIAILAKCRATCDNSTDIMVIMEPSSQTSVLIHMLVISYLQSCLLLVQKQRDKKKNVLPPLMSWVDKGSKDKGWNLVEMRKLGTDGRRIPEYVSVVCMTTYVCLLANCLASC